MKLKKETSEVELRHELKLKQEDIRQLRYALTGLLPFAKQLHRSPELERAIKEAEFYLEGTQPFRTPYPVWIESETDKGEACYALVDEANNIRYGLVTENRDGREGYRFTLNDEFSIANVEGNNATLEGAKADVELLIGMRDRLELPPFSRSAAASR